MWWLVCWCTRLTTQGLATQISSGTLYHYLELRERHRRTDHQRLLACEFLYRYPRFDADGSALLHLPSPELIFVFFSHIYPPVPVVGVCALAIFVGFLNVET